MGQLDQRGIFEEFVERSLYPSVVVGDHAHHPLFSHAAFY